jgi:hypothetical protein
MSSNQTSSPAVMGCGVNQAGRGELPSATGAHLQSAQPTILSTAMTDGGKTPSCRLVRAFLGDGVVRPQSEAFRS